MRRIMRGYSHQSRGTLACFRWERVGARPRLLFRHHRSAFTLVELLVVIGILAVLAALITPAIFQARVSARNAAIKAEIDMLHMAIMNYKNEYGSFPPCASGTSASDPAARHIRRLFPRTPATYAPAISTTPGNALVGWLGGYSSNPVDPLGGIRKKLFDFDQSRVTAGNQYHPSGKAGSPYVYVDAANYGGSSQSVAGFNADTFQITCAGLDEQWGTEDDLSNFWKGTRQDYLDSLE